MHFRFHLTYLKSIRKNLVIELISSKLLENCENKKDIHTKYIYGLVS